MRRIGDDGDVYFTLRLAIEALDGDAQMILDCSPTMF